MNETAMVAQPQIDHLLAIKDVKRQVTAMHELFRDVMQKDVHYGVIPGTEKPTLYKAGAEKIGLLLHLSPSFDRTMTQDGNHLTVLTDCVLTHSPSGVVIARAGAICTTKETKYAFRQATRKCPECGQPAIMKSKEEYGGGWYCFTKKGGCNAKFKKDDPKIATQSGDREDNPNLADAYNTVLKMAEKRAYVAATLFGTAASDIYTQDVEDLGIQDDPPPPPPPPPEVEPSLSDEAMEVIEKFMRGQALGGKLVEYWKANFREWNKTTSKEQMERLTALKDELKEAAETPLPSEADTPPPQAESAASSPAPEPKKPGNGRRRKTVVDDAPPSTLSMSGSSLMKSLVEGGPDGLVEFWKNNRESVDQLPPMDKREIEALSDNLEPLEE